MLRSNHTLSRGLYLGLVLLLAVAMLSACGTKSSKAAVATWKDGKITQTELDKFVNTITFFSPEYASYKELPDFNEYMLKQMATVQILEKKANSDQKKDADTKVDEQMKQIKQYFESQGKNAFKDELKKNNLKESDIKDYIGSSILAMNVIESQVTDEETKAKYDEFAKAKQFDTASVSHILIMTKDQEGKDVRTKEEALARAKEVKAKLDNKGDFSALAKEYSDDPGSKDNGGKYENEVLANSQWDPAFLEKAETLPLNQISDPFESSFGYHIMKVDARGTEDFDKVKDQLKDYLGQEKLQNFMEKDLAELDFKTNLPQPSPSPSASAPAGSASPEASAPAASASPGASAPAASPSASPAAK
ncbi:foldase protein PrsA [Paenibacillus sp. J31TS4]|uniref:peptidylprolyl isomerase n=1 Tax=Paenibacillus sp. J31TS4 TaxID=2807195 RepID=UPI001B095DDC|nr:peptidylprolyl isomerase [Paenibacillus sp. J31TS4]GIP41351.1 foldase protein PrsA [Paenibacillus sp. J31TS4]